MDTKSKAWPLLLAAAACAAQAQTAAPAAPLKYESAFATYRAYQEPQLASWTESNARVAQSPGHGAHGAASADPHAGHDMSKMKAADPHAGHDMGKKKPADPHAGHDMAAPKPPAPASDPHKDH